MNKNVLVKSLMRLLNNNQPQGGSRKVRRGRNWRRFNPVRRQLNQRGNAMGSEWTSCLLTSRLEGTLDQMFTYNLYEIFNNNEGISMRNLWMFYKIQEVCITFAPNNLNTSIRPCYMFFNSSGEANITNLEDMNNVKIVPSYRINFKSYHFNVPNYGIYSYKRWNSTEQYTAVPSTILFHAPNNDTDVWIIRIDAKVKFKQRKVLASGEKILMNVKSQVPLTEGKQPESTSKSGVVLSSEVGQLAYHSSLNRDCEVDDEKEVSDVQLITSKTSVDEVVVTEDKFRFSKVDRCTSNDVISLPKLVGSNNNELQSPTTVYSNVGRSEVRSLYRDREKLESMRSDKHHSYGLQVGNESKA